MPSLNAIRIRRYNRLCKVADMLAEQARHRGYPETDSARLLRIEAIMEDISSGITTGPYS